jgi:hypothetical protein
MGLPACTCGSGVVTRRSGRSRMSRIAIRGWPPRVCACVSQVQVAAALLWLARLRAAGVSGHTNAGKHSMQERSGWDFCWQCHLALDNKPPAQPGKPGKPGKRSRECAADAHEPEPVSVPKRRVWRVMTDHEWIRLCDIWQCYFTHSPLREVLDKHHAQLLREYWSTTPSLETIGVPLAKQADPTARTPLAQTDLKRLINGLDPEYVLPGLPALPPKEAQGKEEEGKPLDRGAAVVQVTGLDGRRFAFGAGATAHYFSCNVRPATLRERTHAILVSGRALARAREATCRPTHMHGAACNDAAWAHPAECCIEVQQGCWQCAHHATAVFRPHVAQARRGTCLGSLKLSGLCTAACIYVLPLLRACCCADWHNGALSHGLACHHRRADSPAVT